MGGPSAEWTAAIDPPDDSWIASIKPVFKYFEERTPGSLTEAHDHTITWHFRDADEDFGEIQASDLQLHLKEVLGNQPVEVCLDGKMVQVRPYGVSKGATLDAVLEACRIGYSRHERRGEDLPRVERESNASGRDDASAEGGIPSPRAGGEEENSGFGFARETDRSKLDFALCLGAHSMRDEDLFGNLLSRELAKERGDDWSMPYSDYLPEPKGTWTCRVGRQPSQARHYVDDEKEVAALLSSLAAATRLELEKDREAAALSLQIDEANADGLGELSGGVGGAGEEEEEVPNALARLDEIETRMEGFQIAFFLDYDGTLTPIVENPSEAKLSEEARSVVRALSARYPTAIVSGRARATAQGLVQLHGVYYAGSHGFDILGPNGSNYKVADSFRPALEEAKNKLEEALGHIPGALVEDNNFSISAHYRMVAEGPDRDYVDEVVGKLVADMPMLRRTYGKMVYELRPSADWDKGKAVEWLIENWIKKEADRPVFPVYIGDDVTDEDAFRVMGGLGGFGIIVSDNATRTSTGGSYSLRSPFQVVQFLEHFARSGALQPREGEDSDRFSIGSSPRVTLQPALSPTGLSAAPPSEVDSLSSRARWPAPDAP